MCRTKCLKPQKWSSLSPFDFYSFIVCFQLSMKLIIWFITMSKWGYHRITSQPIHIVHISVFYSIIHMYVELNHIFHQTHNYSLTRCQASCQTVQTGEPFSFHTWRSRRKVKLFFLSLFSVSIFRYESVLDILSHREHRTSNIQHQTNETFARINDLFYSFYWNMCTFIFYECMNCVVRWYICYLK